MMDSAQKYDIDAIFPTAVKAVLRILNHHDIATCMVGEVAYNYYKVPDVIHVRFKFPPSLAVSTWQPESQSCSVGCGILRTRRGRQHHLNQHQPYEKDPYAELHLYNEYKSTFPRLTTTGWLARPFSFVIFPASICRLQPLATHAFRPVDSLQADSAFSKNILQDFEADDLKAMTFPRLAPFLTSLTRRYLELDDDNMAACAVEHIVEGLDLSDDWCTQHLDSASPEVVDFVRGRIRGKKARIAYYQDNAVTCMLASEEEAKRASRIPGYQ